MLCTGTEDGENDVDYKFKQSRIIVSPHRTSANLHYALFKPFYIIILTNLMNTAVLRVSRIASHFRSEGIKSFRSFSASTTMTHKLYTDETPASVKDAKGV